MCILGQAYLRDVSLWRNYSLVSIVACLMTDFEGTSVCDGVGVVSLHFDVKLTFRRHVDQSVVFTLYFTEFVSHVLGHMKSPVPVDMGKIGFQRKTLATHTSVCCHLRLKQNAIEKYSKD